MPTLYVANTTKQQQIIYYRMDYAADGNLSDLRRFQPAKQTPIIKAGHQIPLSGGEMSMDNLNNVISQLERYGAVAEKDAARLPGRLVPYVMNTEQPVKVRTIEAVLNHNAGILLGQGTKRREAAAIAAKTDLVNAAAEIGALPKDYEATIEQEDISENDEKGIEEGYKVPNDVKSVPDRARPKRGRT